MVAAAPCAARRSGFAQGAGGRHPARQHHGVGVLEGPRRGVPADAHVLHPRRAHLPLPPAVDRLQPRRRPRPPQDPHLGLCGRHHNHVHPRKESQHKEFYAVIFPSLIHGISDTDDRRQRAVCSERYMRRAGEGEDSKRSASEIDAEVEEESGICMELNSRVVLPNCIHDTCIKCYRQCCWMSNLGVMLFSFRCHGF